jgi:hypothetical protein
MLPRDLAASIRTGRITRRLLVREIERADGSRASQRIDEIMLVPVWVTRS